MRKTTKTGKMAKKTIRTRPAEAAIPPTPSITPDADPLQWAKIVCDLNNPNREQHGEQLSSVRNAAIVMVVNILQNCRACPDRAMAVTKIREAIMLAESAILIEWGDPT